MVTAQRQPHSPQASDRVPDQPRKRGGREESFTHFIARESQLFLEVMVIASLVMTVVLMVTLFPFAFIPIMTLLLSYGLLVLANALERYTDPGDMEDTAEAGAALTADERSQRTEAARPSWRRRWTLRGEEALRRRLTRVSIEVILGALLLALVMATFVLPAELVVLGVGVLFAYILFISAPVWLAWMNDETDVEEARQRDHRVTK